MREEKQGTPFTDIFGIFMLDIASDKFASLLTPQELKDTLVGYLNKSCDLYFPQCKHDLSKRDEASFEEKLDEDEKHIIALGMKLNWIDSNHIANDRNLQTRLLTKDYHLYSPANHIRVLHDLRKDLKDELRKEIIAYEYRHYLKENK